MKPIVLIHPFQVEKPQETEFLNAWKAVDQYMQKQAGFIKTNLHQSYAKNPLKAFSYINVALWKNAELFRDAVSTPEFNRLSKKVLEFSQGPGLYESINC